MLDMDASRHKTNRTSPLPPGEGQGEGASIRQLAIFGPRPLASLFPTLPLRGREYAGQQCAPFSDPAQRPGRLKRLRARSTLSLLTQPST